MGCQRQLSWLRRLSRRCKGWLLGLRMAPVPNGDEMAIPSWWAVPRFIAIRGLELKTGPREAALTVNYGPCFSMKKKIHNTPKDAWYEPHRYSQMPLSISNIIHVHSENGNQQTTTSARDWATPDECPSSDRHCMCGQSRCPTGELEVLECYCMGPAICGLVLLACHHPASLLSRPQLHFRVCCAGDSTSYERFS